METEFGCLVAEPGDLAARVGSPPRAAGTRRPAPSSAYQEPVASPEQVVELIKDHVFYELRLGAIDLHARDDVFEPAECGGFLINGARLYIDAVGSHLEYATAECRSLKDIVANDRAGQRQIVRAISELGLDGEVSVYNNCVDHFGGHTFGCHENYLVRADDEFLTRQVQMLYPFLVTRQIFAGVGRVGGHVLTAGGLRPNYQEIMDNPIDYIWVSHVYGVEPDPTVRFQLSQRADHIIKTVASRVRFNRALINPKWEHFYSHEGMTRLHLLFGESNQNEHAYALKIGTTSLVLRLLEEDLVPEKLALAHPLLALREISRDERALASRSTTRWPVVLAEGGCISSIDLQREYLSLASRYEHEDEQTDWVLTEWQSVLDGLERDPLAMGDRVDWVAKLHVVEQYMKEEGLDWGDDALHSVDLEYHNIDPSKSLFYALQEMGQTRRVLTELDVVDAMTESPRNTRALGRSKLVKEVVARKTPRFYMFDWNGAATDRSTYIEMPDPFETYA